MTPALSTDCRSVLTRWCTYLAAMAIAAVAAKDGSEAARGDACCGPSVGPDTRRADARRAAEGGRR